VIRRVFVSKYLNIYRYADSVWTLRWITGAWRKRLEINVGRYSVAIG